MSPEKKKQGFATLPTDKHREVSSKGGKARVPKGLATLTPEQRSENAKKASIIRWAKVKAEREGNGDIANDTQRQTVDKSENSVGSGESA